MTTSSSSTSSDPQLPLSEVLGHLLATADRTGLLELIIAGYAAWETHYSGGYLYTDDPAAVALFDEACEQYRAWREQRVAGAMEVDRRIREKDQLGQRLCALVPDVTYPETVLPEAAHGLDVDDATARTWLVQHRAWATTSGAGSESSSRCYQIDDSIYDV